MKTLAISALLCLSVTSTTLLSQNRASLLFQAGAIRSDIQYSDFRDNNQARYGPSISIGALYNFTETIGGLGLISYTQKGFTHFLKSTMDFYPDPPPLEVRFDYVELTALVRNRLTTGEMAPFIENGIRFSHRVEASANDVDWEGLYKRFKRDDWSLILGLGIQLDLWSLPTSVGLRYEHGLTNIAIAGSGHMFHRTAAFYVGLAI
jgi:hypothetical protein